MKKNVKKEFVNTNTEITIVKILRTSLFIAILLLVSNAFAQTQTLHFNTIEDHSYSEGIGYEYLLANNVRLRDCPSTQCTAITTVKIGTQLRLIKSNENPEIINGITSNWYKVKLGPDTGWIWGGMIAKNTFKSKTDLNVKFAFGLDRFNEEEFADQYQIRAYKNGVQIDKITIKSPTVNALVAQKIEGENLNDVIRLQTSSLGSFGNTTKPIYIVWEGNKFKKVSNLSAAVMQVKNENLSREDQCAIFPLDAAY